ncbi:c-type cytochrome [Blastopirellula marina]|uniref:Cytochrome C n=1 Tax=Blastopirellula marina TaxID=124 RepID=A0A2S8F972_9BACT|nr:c-type cytochrome [Blastopirellula marina]PQO28680.1 cytochrome C [Blastopirellula marina]PTL41953.1 cytochrome C [Blastopirellula marina]
MIHLGVDERTDRESGEMVRKMARTSSWIAGLSLLLGVAANWALAQEVEGVPDGYPPGPLGKVVRLGEAVVFDTSEHPLSKPYVGNKLNCTSCHLDGGTDPQAGSFLGTASAYPAWSPRENRAITLEDRVLNCFMRSENGTRPPNGSEVSVAITTYITWLSTGSKIQMNSEKSLGPRHVQPLKLDWKQASAERGKLLYKTHCLDCHGQNGEGTADGPPVWGQDSYNDGAGLSRIDKLGSWLKVAMPLGDPILTDQESADIAAYVNGHDRPHFKLEEHLPASDRLGEYNGKRDVP